MGLRSYKQTSLIFRKLKKRYSLGNIPIFAKLLLIFGLFVVAMAFLSFFTYAQYKADKDRSTLKTLQQMNEQAVQTIDDYVNDLKNATKLPLFKESMENDFISEMDTFNRTSAKSLLFQTLSEQVAYRIFNYKSTIHSVFFFNLAGISEYKIKSSDIYSAFNPKDEPWFKQSIEAFGSPIVIGTYDMPNIADYSKSPVQVFSVARAIVNVESSEVIGVVLVNNSVDYLAALCNKMIMFSRQRTCIVDETGRIIYDTGSPGRLSLLEADILEEISKNDSGTQSILSNNTDMLMDYRKSKATGWKIITLIPSKELNRNIDQLRTMTTIITLILILIVSLFLFFISNRIVGPLRKLVLLMKMTQKGDFTVKIKLKTRDEVGQLARAFNWMIYKINKMINEAYVEKIKQKELELKMLQYQINPHFLYNTLESIHMMAEISGDAPTSSMIQTLGKFLRYGISRQDDIVTIRDEIDYLKDYILLQEVRFEDTFHIEVDVDESLYSCPVIKLILQPLVENAIYHGLSTVEENGFVKISGRRDGDRILLEVTDNGTGMSSEQAALLNDYLNDLNYSFKSIGLKNVHKRIKLHYGNDYGLEILHGQGQGTTVRLVLPWT